MKAVKVADGCFTIVRDDGKPVFSQRAEYPVTDEKTAMLLAASEDLYNACVMLEDVFVLTDDQFIAKYGRQQINRVCGDALRKTGRTS